MKEGVVNSAFVSNENLQLHRDDEQKPHEKAHEEEFSEGPCGWSNFTPSCLQCCNNAKGFVFIFGLLVIVQSVGYMMTILGVALGYIVGGQLLNIYVDVDQLQDVALSPEDPRWVGGWWIGYLIGLPAAWLLIVPFLGFPKHLPGTAKIHAEKVSQVHHDGSEDIVKEKDVGKSFKDFPLSLKLLLKNPVFMCLTLTATSEGMTSFGTSIFFTKFIENQYGKTASISSLIAGCVIIPGAAIGQVLGGLVVSKFKMKCKQTIRLAIATSFASLMFSACYVLAKCDNPEFAGISVENGATGNLSAPCNANYL
ncbi:solute carrier organic anion transporter family member 4C1-like isoform X2 [Acipenser ruthenus]|uniref:solute carrier organic anion transporter family member 4C1-like isoform X2 n=1 Tax=Acipenser ruthenus TaxID=7906 RepID=UPI002741CAB5|nr:solute carrier organic anion transporter family member 4C1-like isoform X2 [Acipenser ruthenus]